MNSQITQANDITTMSSREIAELTGKRHDNVCVDIEKLNETYERISLLKIQESDYISRGKTYLEFLLTKEQCLDLITGYRTDLRIMINRRWQELENQQAGPSFTIPQTLAEALRLSADLAEQNAEQAKLLEVAGPKAKALDVISSASGSLNIRDTAKTLGIQQKKFVAWCEKHGWTYRDSKNRIQPLSKQVIHDRMELRSVTYGSADNRKATTQAMFTTKGLTRLAEIFAIVKEVA